MSVSFNVSVVLYTNDVISWWCYLLGYIFAYSQPIHGYFIGKREPGLYDIIFWTILLLVSLFTSLSITVTSGRDYLLYDLKFCELLKTKPTK